MVAGSGRATSPVLRMCLGCRRVRERRVLVRIAADAAGALILQPPPGQGRGAYLCASLQCLEKAWQRKAFDRAFRRELSGIDMREVRRRFEADLRRRGVIAG